LLNVRIVIVGILWQVVFRRKLSTTQWLALVLFIAAGFTKGLDASQFVESFEFGSSVFWLGIQILLGAGANVISEVLLKDSTLSVDLINVYTYSSGFVWLLVVLMYQHGCAALYSELLSPSAWIRLQADPWMMASICCLTVFGIVTAYFLKELSNILKELSGGAVLFISTVLTWIFVGTSAITGLGLMALVMAALSIAIYSAEPLRSCSKQADHGDDFVATAGTMTTYGDDIVTTPTTTIKKGEAPSDFFQEEVRALASTYTAVKESLIRCLQSMP